MKRIKLENLIRSHLLTGLRILTGLLIAYLGCTLLLAQICPMIYDMHKSIQGCERYEYHEVIFFNDNIDTKFIITVFPERMEEEVVKFEYVYEILNNYSTEKEIPETQGFRRDKFDNPIFFLNGEEKILKAKEGFKQKSWYELSKGEEIAEYYFFPLLVLEGDGTNNILRGSVLAKRFMDYLTGNELRIPFIFKEESYSKELTVGQFGFVNVPEQGSNHFSKVINKVKIKHYKELHQASGFIDIWQNPEKNEIFVRIIDSQEVIRENEGTTYKANFSIQNRPQIIEIYYIIDWIYPLEILLLLVITLIVDLYLYYVKKLNVFKTKIFQSDFIEKISNIILKKEGIGDVGKLEFIFAVYLIYLFIINLLTQGWILGPFRDYRFLLGICHLKYILFFCFFHSFMCFLVPV